MQKQQHNFNAKRNPKPNNNPNPNPILTATATNTNPILVASGTAQFGSFRSPLRESGWLAINGFSPSKCERVPHLNKTDALCSSR